MKIFFSLCWHFANKYMDWRINGTIQR